MLSKSGREDRSEWGSMLMSRSRSLSPRRTSRRSPSESPPLQLRHRMIPPQEPVTTTMGSIVKSWIMTPTSTAGISKPQSKLFLPKTPILTLLLIKLEETIPHYCQKLAVPTMENSAAAAALLEQTVATASSSPISTPGSSMSSPASPIAGSAMALHSCWETYISPLLLLAAAEALYAKERSPKLIALYVKISSDLTVVQQTLCDPILDNTDSIHYPTASSLTKELIKLREWTSIRCQLIELAVQGASSLQQVRPPFQALLQEVSRLSESNDDMMIALKTEVQLWVWLIDACWHIQQCRFMETILATRRMKVMLESLQTKTKLHEWFLTTLQEMHSLLPIYFDRLRAQAHALHGFDLSRLGTPSIRTDYDALVLDFLRGHDGAMAISIVLEDQNNDAWPSMYLRSSIDSLARSASSGGSLSTRLLLGGRRDEEADEVSHLEQYNSTRGWPHTEWKELVTILRNEVNPEELGPAMTFRPKEVEPSASSPAASPTFMARAPAAPTSYFHVVALSSATCIWLVAIVKDDATADSNKWNLSMSRTGHRHSEDAVRAFMDDMAAKLRVSNLIMNTTIERRETEKVSQGSTPSTASKSAVKKKLMRVLSTDDLVLEWTESKTQLWLGTIKQQFGLRPQSPLVEPLKSPYRLNFRQLRGQEKRSRGRQRRGRGKKSIEESAAAWFLGPELMDLAKEGRLKLNIMSPE